MARKLAEGLRPLTTAERQSRQRKRKAAQTAKLRAALAQIQTARTLREAREIAAAALSYDGINEAIKHRVKGNTLSPSLAEIVLTAVQAYKNKSQCFAEPAASQAAGEGIRSLVEAYRAD